VNRTYGHRDLADRRSGRCAVRHLLV